MSLTISFGHAARRHSLSRLRGLVLAAGAAASLVAATTTLTLPAMAHAQTTAASPAAQAAESLPIKKITLYRSGVGGFLRSGVVPGGSDIQLRFNTEQINDILKSMIVLVDPAAGRLDTVSYGSKEPLAKRLASFGVNIADNPSLPDLLNRLRGASIKVTRTGEAVTGTILGVDKRKLPATKDQAASETDFLTLVTGNGMKSVPVLEISAFEILDEQLAGELTKALAALAEYRADRSKTVNLRFSNAGGGGTVPVTVGYIHEMPVWKTSYRLVLPESPGAAAADVKKPAGQVTMQGWAIVENTTDEDWTDVRLALVSGRPVSFQMDLYEPLYVSRPFVAVPTVPGVMPRIYDQRVAAMAEVPEIDLASTMGKAGQPRRARASFAASPGAPAAVAEGGPMGSAGGLAFADAMNAADLTDYAAEARARAAEVGEVFQYELEQPVTIERQRSAMIPIITATIEGNRVSIFNLADGSPHPMRGVQVTNTSDLQLLPGPISVYDGPAYAGDAQVGHVGAGDKQLLAYAVDLDVAAVVTPENATTIQRVKIVNGMFEQTVKTVSKTTYAFENKDEKRSRALIVEHAKMYGWNLVEPSKPSEETSALYRFNADLAPGKAGKITVVQDRIDYQRYGITDYDMGALLQFNKDGKLSDAVLAAVREAAKRQGTINTIEREIAQIDAEKQRIDADQARIRENMKVTDRTSENYSRWAKKLSDQETRIEELLTQRGAAQQRLDTARQDYNTYIGSLNVE